MDEFNNITEVELPDDIGVEAFEPSQDGISDGMKTVGAVGLGIGLGLLGHWVYGKIKAKRAAKLEDDPEQDEKPKKGHIKLARKKKQDDGVDDDDAATEETEDK